MAYINQEMKAQIKSEIDKVIKKYGKKVSYSLAIKCHLRLDVTISKSEFNFLENFPGDSYITVNPYFLDKYFRNEELTFLKEFIQAINSLNHDNPNPHTDYFDVGYYTNVSIGKWEKPFVKL